MVYLVADYLVQSDDNYTKTVGMVTLSFLGAHDNSRMELGTEKNLDGGGWIIPQSMVDMDC